MELQQIKNLQFALKSVSFRTAKLSLEISSDGTIKAIHGYDKTVLLTGKAGSPDAWNSICRAIYENTTEATGPMATSHATALGRSNASAVAKGHKTVRRRATGG
mgnify:CR=1 FL=1